MNRREEAEVSARATEVTGQQLTSRDTLHAATACKTTDSRLSDALDVVTEDLAVALGTTFAEAFSTFSTWRR